MRDSSRMESRHVESLSPIPGTEGLNDSQLSVSVVIPAFTMERWGLIQRAVESMRRQTTRPESIVLCIDNNDELLACATARWRGIDGPPIYVVPNEFTDHLKERRLHEYVHGTSRNFGAGSVRDTGASHVTADIIAFLDDDAWAEPDLLEQLSSPYSTPGVVAVGGAALPYFETERPDWFPSNFDWVFGCSYTGLPESTGPLLHLIGTNMSVRRTALARIGGFHGSGFDDLNLCLRLADVYGATSVQYNPRAIVHHYVPCQRVTWRYFYRQCYFPNQEKVRVHTRMGAAANLTAERDFVQRAICHELPSLMKASLRGDTAALKQAGAMLAGISLAGLGYARGKLRTRRSRA